MILSLSIGDGCLFYHKRGKKTYGGFAVEHCVAQKDYLEWKAKLISNITGRAVKVRNSKGGTAAQISVCMKRFKAWRKWLYPNGKKDVTRILKYIDNPWFCIAVWLMDDGNVNPSITNKKLYGARLRIYSMETPIDQQQVLIDWMTKELGVTPTVGFQKRHYKEQDDPFLKFNQKDSLIIWEQIRDFVLQFYSMQYKFRNIEAIYLRKCKAAQCTEK